MGLVSFLQLRPYNQGVKQQKKRLIARTNNIEVQGLRAEVEQLRRELRQRPQNQLHPQYQYPPQYQYLSISIPTSVAASSVSKTIISKQYSSKNDS